MINSFNKEVDLKLEFIRKTLTETGAIALRLRGNDWFSWATAGGSNTVLLTAETGVAELLITAENAVVLTDEIADQRLQDEELPDNFQMHIYPWADVSQRQAFVKQITGGGNVMSDRHILLFPDSEFLSRGVRKLLQELRCVLRQYLSVLLLRTRATDLDLAILS